jgi:hypothetical protein
MVLIPDTAILTGPEELPKFRVVFERKYAIYPLPAVHDSFPHRVAQKVDGFKAHATLTVNVLDKLVGKEIYEVAEVVYPPPLAEVYVGDPFKVALLPLPEASVQVVPELGGLIKFATRPS